MHFYIAQFSTLYKALIPHRPDLQVDFNSSKNELSTKKIRRKAEKAMKKEVITLFGLTTLYDPEICTQKCPVLIIDMQLLKECFLLIHWLGYLCSAQVKAKLYSNFVKSGTLTGGKMEEAEEGDSGFVEDKVKA